MQYKVTVDEKHTFDVSDDLSLDTISADKNQVHLLHNNHSYLAEVVTSDLLHRKYTVKVNNVSFSVSIQNELDLLIHEMGFETGANKLIDAIKAPMPGLILEISVSIGQKISKNDPMLILSAMKMENGFLSPRDGIIKAVHANVGDAVDKGQLLIEFE